MPVEVKEGKGNPGKRRMPTPPPRVQGQLQPPKGMKGAALECWERNTKLLAGRMQLTLDSYESLVRLCKTCGELDRLEKLLEKEGPTLVVTATNGEKQVRAHPAVAMLQNADQRYRAWLIEFGLTDASRGKVNVGRPPAPPTDGKGAKGDASKPTSAADRYGLN